jgi:hypothetical protein
VFAAIGAGACVLLTCVVIVIVVVVRRHRKPLSPSSSNNSISNPNSSQLPHGTPNNSIEMNASSNRASSMQLDPTVSVVCVSLVRNGILQMFTRLMRISLLAYQHRSYIRIRINVFVFAATATASLTLAGRRSTCRSRRRASCTRT